MSCEDVTGSTEGLRTFNAPTLTIVWTNSGPNRIPDGIYTTAMTFPDCVGLHGAESKQLLPQYSRDYTGSVLLHLTGTGRIDGTVLNYSFTALMTGTKISVDLTRYDLNEPIQGIIIVEGGYAQYLMKNPHSYEGPVD